MEEQEDYSERLEAVYQAYKKSLDLEIALSVVPMRPETRTRLQDDPDLHARVALHDANAKEALFGQLKDLAEGAANEGVRLQALKELGRTIYPKRFKEGGAPSAPPIKVKRLPKVDGEWSAEYVEAALADMQQYTDEVEFPTEAEYCYSRGVAHKLAKKYLAAGLEQMAAKRQAVLIRRGWTGDDQLGTFLTKVAANADDFSLVDKHEVGGPNGEPIPISIIKRVVVGPDGK